MALSTIRLLPIAKRIQEAEVVHAIATGGLVAAIRQINPDSDFLEQSETSGKMGSWTNHGSERNREMYIALAPVLSDGFEALGQLSMGPRLLEGISDFLRSIAGWINRLSDASPRWLKWPETVAYVAKGAKKAFSTPYQGGTLANVIETTPAWQSFTSEAIARLDQAQAVQALTARPSYRLSASARRPPSD